MKIRHPPGRGGRLWLVDRIAVAERAAGILHRKQQALAMEDRRLRTLAERTGAAWTAAVREAETWQRRTMVLEGRSAFRAAVTAAGPAAPRLVWRSEMGVELPGEASCQLSPPTATAGSPALAAAASSYRRALDAGVTHAAATAAAGRVRAELALTRQRLRAVRGRWIPELRTALGRLELSLDEHEREELTRSRLHRPGSVTAPTLEHR